MINIINLNEKLYCGEYIFRAENYESNGFLKYIIDKTNKNNKLIAEFIKGYIYKNLSKALGLEYSEELFKHKKSLRNKGERVASTKMYQDYGISIDDMFCDVIID